MGSFATRVVHSLFMINLSRFATTARQVRVIRGREGLTFVPQDIPANVTKLELPNNDIEVLNHTSFSLFERMNWLQFDKNPLEIINNGTFDNNPLLVVFQCYECRIKVLPSSFGPATNKINRLSWNAGIADTGCITSPYFGSFISLERLSIGYNYFRDFSHIDFPPSIKILATYRNGLSHFPNLTSLRFPVLRELFIGDNNLRNISDSTLAAMNSRMTYLSLVSAKLIEIGNVAMLTQLRYLSLRSNKLETIPDLLGLSRLSSLYIGGNTRMTCDRRMCWRGLWDRVRSKLNRKDDAECKAPSVVRGHRLSRISPGFMQCDQGEGSLVARALIARFMGPTWGPSGADRTQVGAMLAPWTLLPGVANIGPTWGRQDPGGSHVGHMNLAIWVTIVMLLSGNMLRKAYERW